MIEGLDTHLKDRNYEVKLIWDQESGGDVYIQHFPKLQIDIPVEFGGKGRYPCPDELFLSSIGGCLLTTFLYFREKLKLKLLEFTVSIRGQVQYVGSEGYRLTGITSNIFMEVDENDLSLAHECIEYTKEYCHLTRMLEKGIPCEIRSTIN